MFIFIIAVSVSVLTNEFCRLFYKLCVFGCVLLNYKVGLGLFTSFIAREISLYSLILSNYIQMIDLSQIDQHYKIPLG